MASYLLVDADGNAVNAVEWDGASDWRPPTGLAAIPYAGPWQPGWKWDGSKLFDPNPPPAPKPPDEAGATGMTVV